MKKSWSLTTVIIMLVFAIMNTSPVYAFFGSGRKVEERERVKCDPRKDDCNKNVPAAPAAPVTPAPVPAASAAPVATNEDELVSKFVEAMKSKFAETEKGFKKNLDEVTGKTKKLEVKTVETDEKVTNLTKKVDNAVGGSKYWAERSKIRAEESKGYTEIAKTEAGKSETSANAAAKSAEEAKNSEKKSREEANKSEASAEESKKTASGSFWFMIVSILAAVVSIGTAVFFFRKAKKTVHKQPIHGHKQSVSRDSAPTAEDLKRAEKVEDLRVEIDSLKANIAKKQRQFDKGGLNVDEMNCLQTGIDQMSGELTRKIKEHDKIV